MIICGMKLTHDGAIALIHDGRLVFSHEMEKMSNNPRYKELDDFEVVDKILDQYGYSFSDVDRWVIDGWGDLQHPGEYFVKRVRNGADAWIDFKLARYGHLVINQNVLEPLAQSTPQGLHYNSYIHVAGHIAGAYCTSDFSKRGEDSFILVWDGGMTPQLFYFHHHEGRIENLRPLFLLNGNIYCFFAQKFPPFDKTKADDISIGGKIMAYIALGTLRPNLLEYFKKIYDNDLDKRQELTFQVVTKFAEHAVKNLHSPEDAMATFHFFIEHLLVKTLAEKVSRLNGYRRNLCFAGGCALNIKWNHAIRSSKIFDEVWVPPFPNDSGSAIGTACCEMINVEQRKTLEWNVYCGPSLLVSKDKHSSLNWQQYSFSVRQFAEFLSQHDHPVVLLQGRAEAGPRALGNRSIIATARSIKIKDTLNQIKQREDYRPVAPICLEEDAPEIFSPGTPDPYMLFEHWVRSSWKDKIPAICHLDQTARLQTVNKDNNPLIYELLQEYKKITSVPVLCNTSANHHGKGFFPDVKSAMEWKQTNFIWSNGTMYVRDRFEYLLASEGMNQDTESHLSCVTNAMNDLAL
jgi:carbamoyltransferase